MEFGIYSDVARQDQRDAQIANGSNFGHYIRL
jgi:hypothetical protein